MADPDVGTSGRAGEQWSVPTFADAHVHVTGLPPEDGDALVHRGVTRVRDLGGQVPQVRSWAGQTPGLQLVAFGGQLDQSPLPPHLSTRLGATGVRHFGEVLDHLATLEAQGARGVKLYVGFPPELVRLTVDEAHRRGLRVAFHLGTGSLPAFSRTRAVQAARAGVDSIEHIHSLTADLLDPAALEDFARDRIDSVGRAFGRVFRAWATLDVDSPRARELIATLAATGCVLVPTLVPFALMAGDDLAEGGASKGTVGAFRAQVDIDPAAAVRGLTAMGRFVAALAAAGGHLAVGTDAASGTGVPMATAYGTELRLLLEAGMSPQQVLAAAAPAGERATRLGLPEAGRDDVQVLRGRDLGAALLSGAAGPVRSPGGLVRDLPA